MKIVIVDIPKIIVDNNRAMFSASGRFEKFIDDKLVTTIYYTTETKLAVLGSLCTGIENDKPCTITFK